MLNFSLVVLSSTRLIISSMSTIAWVSKPYFSLTSWVADFPEATFSLRFTEMTKPSPSNNSPASLVDRLKALKDLLDIGAITQEDYDQKKQSILQDL